MSYVFQFGVVVDNLPALLRGAWLTLLLSGTAMALGLVLAVACAYLRVSGPRPVRWIVAAYVEAFRNTPLLIQLFIIYFTLPELARALGFRLRLDANEAALIGLTLILGAYATEIVRAGIEAIPRGQIEAARALALRPLQIFRHVILFPAIQAVFPALASQFVLLLLGSSIVSAISAEELTAVTNSLQSTTFRAFEFYFATTAIYLALALACRGVLGAVYWLIFMRGRQA